MKPFFHSDQTGKARQWRSIALALGMHGLLLAFLVIGVNWKRQSEAPVGISAQIWSEAPAAAPPAPIVKSEPKPEPKPEPKAKLEPKPEPKIEAKAKPDIVVKPAEPKKPPEKKVEAKKEPAKEVKDPKIAKEAKDAKDAKEAQANEEQRRKELDRLVAAAQVGAASTPATAGGGGGAKADAEYGAKLRSLLRSNTVFASAQEMEGNPEVTFAVRLRPDCSIAAVRLQKSSNVPSWDAAAERAIKRSDPFPQLKDGTCPRDELVIRQKPKD